MELCIFLIFSFFFFFFFLKFHFTPKVLTFFFFLRLISKSEIRPLQTTKL